MQTVVRRLDRIYPWELDMYLASGWYRMGQGIYTCSVLWGELGPTPVIWTRLPLKDFAFDKRQRKLMRRNSKRFKVEVRRFVFHEEQEKLFALYRAFFDGYLAPSFKEQVNGPAEGNVFDSLEVAIYDGDELVAFSLFDEGMDSTTSISGIYHPAYARYSLGYWTMLLEIAYSLEKKKGYYYPGYVVPGIPKFDYKLRIGKNIEGFLPVESRWIPYRRFPHELLEPNIIIKLLSLLLEELVKRGIRARLFPKMGLTFGGARGLLIRSREFMSLYFDSPWLLVVSFPAVSDREWGKLVVVSYNLKEACFHLGQQALPPHLSELDEWPFHGSVNLRAFVDEDVQDDFPENEVFSCADLSEALDRILSLAHES